MMPTTICEVQFSTNARKISGLTHWLCLCCVQVYFGTAIHNVADLISGNLEDNQLSRVFFWCIARSEISLTS